jgi:hypothetical protein
MSKCHNCGALLNRDNKKALFCEYCGALQPVERDADIVVSQKIHSELALNRLKPELAIAEEILQLVNEKYQQHLARVKSEKEGDKIGLVVCVLLTIASLFVTLFNFETPELVFAFGCCFFVMFVLSLIFFVAWDQMPLLRQPILDAMKIEVTVAEQEVDRIRSQIEFHYNNVS